MRKILYLLISTCLLFVACGGPQEEEVVIEQIGETQEVGVDVEVEEEVLEVAEYKTISAEDAKERLEEETEILLLDVRTQEEYDSGHIPGAKLLTLDIIQDQVESMYPDKAQKMFVYCRSGRRSKVASQILLDIGYQDVYDLGGLIDWPYEIEQ